MQVTVATKLPAELAARLDAESKAQGTTKSRLARELIEIGLNTSPAVETPSPRGVDAPRVSPAEASGQRSQAKLEAETAPARPAPASPQGATRPPEEIYRCPLYRTFGCQFKASSPNAICAAHGRKVVPS